MKRSKPVLIGQWIALAVVCGLIFLFVLTLEPQVRLAAVTCLVAFAAVLGILFVARRLLHH